MARSDLRAKVLDAGLLATGNPAHAAKNDPTKVLAALLKQVMEHA